jgi:D-alanyl-D-alanine carboxypeptidase
MKRNNRGKKITSALAAILIAVSLSACSLTVEQTGPAGSEHQAEAHIHPADKAAHGLAESDSGREPTRQPDEDEGQPAEGKPLEQPQPATPGDHRSADSADAIQVAANPDDITVLVNKQFKLPENYNPDDLVEPNVPFIFEEKLEKRKMRREAAKALEEMFAAAKDDGIYLAGVSGYRSEQTQRALYENYAARDGEEAANRYSAKPGHSEHQTGLAMDVSGSDGKCAAEDCFADTQEAKWLAEHAHEYGFIIRYPQGKEAITGYQYEPWHLRYVGKEAAREIAAKGITLEEYWQQATPIIRGGE